MVCPMPIRYNRINNNHTFTGFSMIEIYLLEQLAAFSKYGTLVGAADALHITQPALSRSMKKLENKFGVSLFHRENSKIFLNETGKIAAEYAEKVLSADSEMIDRVIAFDHQQRTISLGSCTPFPVLELLPVLQDRFIGMAINSEIADDEKLISGIRNRIYQLAVFHERPLSKDLFCQRFIEEQLYISLPENHPLAAEKDLSFSDLSGMSILVSGNIGFWMDIARKHCADSNLLVQNNLDAMSELVEASTLPCFNSDRMMERGYAQPGRISIPIRDADAHVTYYIVCLSSEQKRFAHFFSDIRALILHKD